MEKLWRIAPWFVRLILVPPTFIFGMIATRYILHPAQNAAMVGIALTSPLGATIARVGLGGFPLACSLFTLWCLISRRRVLTGLTFVTILVSAVLAVRAFGIAVDGTAAQSMHLVRVEAILLTVFVAGLAMELTRRRRQPLHAA